MNEFVIFVVEDDPWYGEMLEHHLKLNPEYIIYRYMKGKDCLANLYRKPSVITLDYNLPDITGYEVLKSVKQQHPDIQVLIISEQQDIATAVKLLKEGAYDYFVKKDEEILNRLWNTLIKIRENLALKGELENLREKLASKYEFEKAIIGNSPAITRIFNLIEKACKTNITVSISGETGTGKELVAKAIHYNSNRRKKPFVAVNMAAIPRELMESELFGFEKGSFTGAIARRTGKFEEAIGGTLFLDEVSELDINLQSKLLRVLQERELVRIGGGETIKLDIRFVVATNRNLQEEIKKGNFREDLYFRLLGLPIQLPPLRERGNDVLILAKHFAEEFCQENKLTRKSFSNEAKEKLLKYHYPGNVRELKAIIDLAVVMSDTDAITADDVSYSSISDAQELFIDENMTLDDYNRKIIKSYLDKYNSNMLLVAQKLDIGKSTLYRMRQNKEI
jgi:two-component system response regulator AtoC